MIDSLSTPSEKNFIIYRSSAGSGKTYTLAREYILLALQYPSYFRSILAVTFTNKATAEMKKRIIENLDELRNGGGKGLRVEIREALALTDTQLSEKARQSLEAILHDYSHFAVSTIDKFFQRILRAFAREVGIQGGVTLELDQNKVLEAIIDKMLMEVGENPRLTGWLTEFAEQKLQEGKSWDIRKDIRSLGTELFKERFKVVSQTLDQVAEDEATVQNVLKGMHELRAMFENTVQGYISTFEKLMEQYGLDITQFSRGIGGPAGLFSKFAKKEYEITDKRREAAEVLDHWITKTAQNRPELERALEGGILQAYNGLITYHDRYITQYFTAEQIMRYLYTLGIMADLSRKLADYRDEEEVMLISDAPDFLKRIIGNNSTPYVYEKAGSFYRHYLIDEFQDTSGFQWENFRPLVKNSLDEGHRNLVVGDVKQSIYRWRGGDLQLLLGQVQSDIGDAFTEARNLQFNWRSCANIINFNNQLFERSPALLGGLLEEDAGEIIDGALQLQVLKDLARLKTAYHEAAQKQGNENKLGGLVQCQWLEVAQEEGADDEEISWQEQAIQKTIETVEQLQDANYSLKDICILVRKADEGRQVARALLEKKEFGSSKYRYDVISPESLYLVSSPVVRLLLSAFHYLYNPADTLSRAQLAYEYHHFLLGNESPLVADLFLWSGSKEKEQDFEALLPAGFLSQKEGLLRVPLLELAERLIDLFGLTAYPREFPYLQGFQDTLLEYNKSFRSDVGSFLEWWEETGCRRSIQVPEELDAIRVMTIHKAKGLEFKTVLVPFCCWELDHKLEEILWCPAPAEKPFDKLPFYPVRYSSKLSKTFFAEAYYKEKLQIYLDNLNLLYVAFTRAEEALYAFAPLPTFNKSNGTYKKSKVSDLLYCLLMEPGSPPFEMSPAPQADQELLKVVIGKLPGYSEEKIEPFSTVKLRNYLSTNWRQRLNIRLKGGTLDAQQQEKSLASTRRGTIFHRILSQIRQLEDLPTVLSSVLPFEALEQDEQAAVKYQLEKLFELPEMRQWYGTDWEIKTESPVLPAGGDIRRFDRVLLKGGEAVLIEFKTGLASGKHIEQALDYVDLLSGMGYSKVSGYLVYIDTLTVKQVA